MSERPYTPEEAALLHRIHDHLDRLPAPDLLRKHIPPRPPRDHRSNDLPANTSPANADFGPNFLVAYRVIAAAFRESGAAGEPGPNLPAPKTNHKLTLPPGFSVDTTRGDIAGYGEAPVSPG